MKTTAQKSGQSWFQATPSNDAFENLTNDQLKERLMVSETIMKRLYSRNKELEEQLSQKVTIDLPHESKADDAMEKLIRDFKIREEALEAELRKKDELFELQ